MSSTQVAAPSHAPVFRRAPGAGVAQATREGVLGAVVAVGAAAVVAMWFQDTGAGALHSVGDELTAVGRLTGLVGTYLVLIEVLLLGRLPVLDRLVGMDRLTVWHRRNGEYVVGLLVVHALAIVAGYALTDHRSLIGETTDVVLHYTDVLAATVSLGLLVAVGVASARAVRRKLSYHAWYFLHLYTYLAVVLAFAHQFATGDDFVGHTMHRVYWAALHLGTVGLLVWYRAVVPLRANARYRLEVAHIVPEAPGVTSIHVTGRRLGELEAEPGQFFLWRFLTREGWWQAHPFSLSAAPDGRSLRITVKQAGDHTAWMQGVHPGTRVMAEGPYGALTARRRSRRKVLLVAGGIGVAPLRALFEALPAGRGDITFVYRATQRTDLVFWAELEELARRRGARLGCVLGPRHQQPDPLGPELFRANLPDLADHDVYLCGPPAFVDQLAGSVLAAGAKRRRLHTERFEL